MNPNDKTQATKGGSEESTAAVHARVNATLARRFEDLATACEVKANHAFTTSKITAADYRSRAATWQEAARMVRGEI